VTDSEDEIEIDVVDDRDSAGFGSARPHADEDATTATDERSLGDELGSLRIHTTPEGYVEGRVTGIESVDASTARLTVALPHGQTVEFTLEKPIPWSREFLLARIVEDVGYDAASVEYLVGETVYVERTDAGPTADEDGTRWASTLAATGNALLSTVGGRYRIEADAEPEWRLVDPPERPSDDDAEPSSTVGVGLVVLGVLVAALGAAVGATGGVALTGGVLAAALVGLLLAFVGLSALPGGRDVGDGS